jgi:tetratricopeptide (TPR) repeat protein
MYGSINQALETFFRKPRLECDFHITTIFEQTMKKVIFALAAFFLITFAAQAQEDGLKLAKQAGKALASYNLDPNSNKAKLAEAIQKIDQAMQSPEAKASASAWLTRGDIYNRRLDSDLGSRVLNPQAPFTGDNDALEAFEAYKNAYENPEVKKYEKTDALKGIQAVQGSLINIGGAKYEQKEYEKAYLSYEASLQAHNIITAGKGQSVLEDVSILNDQKYFTAVIAAMAKRCKDAVPYLEELIKLDSSKAYEPLYNCKIELGDEAGADKILAEGRKKFPEDSGLLFAEINSYLKKGKLDELTDRLKQAIKQEPNNIGLYVTLGNVYDNLYQAMSKEKNTEKANLYFGEAKKYYEQATAKDPKNVDAVYSLGALYYNQAAVRTQELNALPEDYSSAGLKKLKTLRDEILALFDQSLPYFQKAENLNPNDVNTLIALNEIYARKEDELSLEFKKRLEVVKGGGKNSAPYFKN